MNRPPLVRRTVMALALLGSAAASAAPAPGCALLEIRHVRPAQGQLLVQAFASAETFRKQVLSTLRLPAGDSDTARVELCGLGDAAEVAVLMFQDLDGNGRMGTNLVGMPTEPWGASGSPGSFGPTWETTRVKLDGGVVVVRLSS